MSNEVMEYYLQKDPDGVVYYNNFSVAVFEPRPNTKGAVCLRGADGKGIAIINDMSMADIESLFENIVELPLPPSESLYNWELVPAGYDWVACDKKMIHCYTGKPEGLTKLGEWCLGDDDDKYLMLPLSVLNRVPGEPSTTLEKRPGVE